MKCCSFCFENFLQQKKSEMKRASAAPAVPNANHEIGFARSRATLHTNRVSSQFVQFSCCAEPHNCAFCCNLSPSLPTRLFFLHATSCFFSFWVKKEIALLFSCQCCRLFSHSGENKQFFIEIVDTKAHRVKIHNLEK